MDEDNSKKAVQFLKIHIPKLRPKYWLTYSRAPLAHQSMTSFTPLHQRLVYTKRIKHASIPIKITRTQSKGAQGRKEPQFCPYFSILHNTI